MLVLINKIIHIVWMGI